MTTSAIITGDEGLFVYGTLRFPEVLRILLGRVPAAQPAVAAGWRVRALPGVTYPGLVADPGAAATGLLMTGLTAGERRLLDAYEDDSYERRLLTLDGGRSGWGYVWKHETEPYDWDPDRFAEHELPGFLKWCAAWRRDFAPHP